MIRAMHKCCIHPTKYSPSWRSPTQVMMNPIMGWILTSRRFSRRDASLRLIVCLGALLSIVCWQSVLICQPAYAEAWIMVAKSDATQEYQYVDIDSIKAIGSVVRLKTYWGFLNQPDSISYATTEYQCQTEEYRDVIVNDSQTSQDWQPVGDDPLNRAAMEYGCSMGHPLKSSP